MQDLETLRSLKLTSKWKHVPWNTMILYKQLVLFVLFSHGSSRPKKLSKQQACSSSFLSLSESILVIRRPIPRSFRSNPSHDLNAPFRLFAPTSSVRTAWHWAHAMSAMSTDRQNIRQPIIGAICQATGESAQPTGDFK